MSLNRKTPLQILIEGSQEVEEERGEPVKEEQECQSHIKKKLAGDYLDEKVITEINNRG